MLLQFYPIHCQALTLSGEEWIGTFSVGYNDGIRRHLSSNGQEIIGYVRRDSTKEKCPIIGTICMGATIVRLPECPSPRESFTLISNDYDPDTSAVGIARKVCTVGSEISVGLLGRHAIVYIKAGLNPLIISANSY